MAPVIPVLQTSQTEYLYLLIEEEQLKSKRSKLDPSKQFHELMLSIISLVSCVAGFVVLFDFSLAICLVVEYLLNLEMLRRSILKMDFLHQLGQSHLCLWHLQKACFLFDFH